MLQPKKKINPDSKTQIKKGFDFIDKKYGTPNVVQSEILPQRARYIPGIKAMFLKNNRESEPDDYLAELAHYHQENTNIKRKSNNYSNKLNLNSEQGYTEPGNVEFQAHSEIEPYMKREFDSVRGAKYSTKKEIENNIQYNKKEYENNLKQRDSLINDLSNVDRYQGNRQNTKDVLNSLSRNQFSKVKMGLTDELRFIGNDILGSSKEIYSDIKEQLGFAMGGNINNNMNRYAQGGDLTRFDTGGTHEQNKLGGIPIGNNNSVEENETKNGNFIYSNRIFLDENIISQYNLPKSLAGKSVADATKFIDNKFKGRNDKISQSTKDSMLSKIAEAQEAMKPQEPEMEQDGSSETFDGMSQMSYGGYKKQMFAGGLVEDSEPTIVTNEGQIEANKLKTDQLDQKMQNYTNAYNTVAPVIANTINSQGNDTQRSQTLQSINALGSTAGSLIGGSAGSTVGNAVTGATGLYEMGSEAFGKSNVDTSGVQPTHGASAGKAAGAGALKGAGTGAAIGSMIMPGLGTAIGAVGGAVVGGVAGFAGGKKDEKAQARNNSAYANKYNQQFSDKYAYGGSIDPPIPMRSDDQELAMERYKLLRAGAVQGSGIKSDYKPDLRTPEQSMMDYQYLRDSVKPGFNVNSGYTPNLTSPEDAQILYNKRRGNAFAMGGNLNKMADGGDYYENLKLNARNQDSNGLQSFLKPVSSTVPYAIGTQPIVDISNANRIDNPGPSNLDILKYNVGKIGNTINDNAANVARYAPIAANAYQLAKLKKSEGVRLNRLDNRYKPSYVDMAQQQNIVNQELNNTNSAIQQSGASQGAARNAILGAQLNKTKALSNAYMNAEAQNRQQDAIAQQFNLGIDQTNLQQSNSELDINDRNSAAYRNEKSKYLTAVGEGIGDIGKEQVQKKMISTATGYTYDGKYVKSPDGNIVVDPDTGEPMTDEKMKTLQSSKNVKKQALGGYLIKNKIK
jgi:hypothetical protein